LCLALASLVLLWLHRPLGKKLGIAAAVSVVIAGLSPLGNMLLLPLEQRFPGLQFPDRRIDGIIVLGGSYDRIRGYLSTIILDDNTDPVVVVASLSRRYPDAKIIFSGGTESSLIASEAATARQLFISFGVIPDRIVVEDQSRNTEENARFTARAIGPKPGTHWLLVTNAFHMPRAMGAFRKAGFDVSAFPVGWRADGWHDLFWPAPSATENLRRVDVATREWLGLAVYRMLGFSDDLFPAPAQSR
jgi:uncharacterized SAM-binding protein YcdF (DUF218 family)